MRGQQGRRRQHQEAKLEFTREAYEILEAAALRVLGRWNLVTSEYVTKEDLIDYAWLRTFLYLRKPEDIRERMFIYALQAMNTYLRTVAPRPGGRRIGSSLGDEDGTPWEPASERELDDPAVVAELFDRLHQLTPRDRFVIVERLLGGCSLQELAGRIGRTPVRVLQIIREVQGRALREENADAHGPAQ